MDSRLIRGAALMSCYFLLSAYHSSLSAQPSSISPRDAARLQQQTNFNADFSRSPRYDFENPVSLTVTLTAFNVPESGYANLGFYIDSIGDEWADFHPDLDEEYWAILQVANEIRGRRLEVGAVRSGQEVKLIGWPSTEANLGQDILLVDEIQFVRSGKTIRLHDSHPEMKRHPAALVDDQTE